MFVLSVKHATQCVNATVITAILLAIKALGVALSFI